jgi:hypothetical protein
MRWQAYQRAMARKSSCSLVSKQFCALIQEAIASPVAHEGIGMLISFSSGGAFQNLLRSSEACLMYFLCHILVLGPG